MPLINLMRGVIASCAAAVGQTDFALEFRAGSMANALVQPIIANLADPRIAEQVTHAISTIPADESGYLNRAAFQIRCLFAGLTSGWRGPAYWRNGAMPATPRRDERAIHQIGHAARDLSTEEVTGLIGLVLQLPLSYTFAAESLVIIVSSLIQVPRAMRAQVVQRVVSLDLQTEPNIKAAFAIARHKPDIPASTLGYLLRLPVLDWSRNRTEIINAFADFEDEDQRTIIEAMTSLPLVRWLSPGDMTLFKLVGHFAQTPREQRQLLADQLLRLPLEQINYAHIDLLVCDMAELAENGHLEMIIPLMEELSRLPLRRYLDSGGIRRIARNFLFFVQNDARVGFPEDFRTVINRLIELEPAAWQRGDWRGILDEEIRWRIQPARIEQAPLDGIDIHSRDRDARTIAAYQLLQAHGGELSEKEIDTAVDEFREYLAHFGDWSRECIPTMERAKRALSGERGPEDFAGLLDTETFVNHGQVIRGRELLAHVWRFSQSYEDPKGRTKEERGNIEAAIVGALASSFEPNAAGDGLRRVCPPGQMQRLLVKTIQDRLQIPGTLRTVQIDVPVLADLTETFFIHEQGNEKETWEELWAAAIAFADRKADDATRRPFLEAVFGFARSMGEDIAGTPAALPALA